MTNNAYIRQLDPIQGLIDYVEDIKPYHTKIIEVMIEYVYDDKTAGTVRDAVEFTWGPSKFPATVDIGLNGLCVAPLSAQDFYMFSDFSNAIFPGDVITLSLAGSPTVSQDGIVTAVCYAAGTTVVTVGGGSPPPTFTDGEYDVWIPGDVTQNFSFDITDIDDVNQTITVSGPATADVFNGQQFTVTGTASNDGVYTVQGSPTFNGLSTIFPVAETLIAEVVGISPVPTITPVRYYIP